MKSTLLAFASLSLVPACLDAQDDLDSTTQAATGEQGLHGAAEPHQFADKEHGARPGGGGGGSSPLMTLHGGNVIPAAKPMAIFWGSEWSTPSFAGDKITGLDAFFNGFSGSRFAGTGTEYAGADGKSVTTSATYLGHTFDSSATPRRALSTSDAVSEACKIVNNNPDPAGIYFIYTSTGAGHASYCAWHSWGTCSNGAPIQVAYMPNIDGLAGCDPGDTSGAHSQGLAAVANVTSHELMEAITDPRGTGWFDSSGAENGDKCAWTFAAPVTLSNGSTWKLQQEWSNAAYNASQGSPRGCIQGN